MSNWTLSIGPTILYSAGHCFCRLRARVRAGALWRSARASWALDDAAPVDGSVRPGTRLTTQRIGCASRLRMVDAVLSKTHEPGTSHYELLRAFLDEDAIRRLDPELSVAK